MHKTEDIYLFGPFQLDAGERVLVRDGRPVALTPKAFDMLLVLVSNRGRLLAKEKLLAELWPDAFIEEKTLSQHVFMIRKALGPGPDGESYIETVPKHGYRFTADVRVVPRTRQTLVVEGHAPPTVTKGGVEVGKGRAAQGAPAHGLAATISTGGLAVSSSVALGGGAGAATDLAPRPRDAARRTPRRLVLAVCVVAAGLVLAAGALMLRALRANRDVSPSRPFQHFDLVRLASMGNVGAVSLSPDGKYVAYASVAGGRERLLVQQIGNTSSVEVVAPAEVTYVGVTFSNDGASLFYVTRERGSPLGVLYQVPTLGGTPRKLVEDVDSPVTFSPDGQQLAFVRNDPHLQETVLIITGGAGGAERKLAARNALSGFSLAGPSWSPDGKLIACAQDYQLSWQGYSELLFVNTTDGAVTPVRLSGWQRAEQVAWLPDGSGLILVGQGPEAQYQAGQIWHFAYPSGATRRITSDPNRYLSVSIAKDAQTALTVHAERVSSLWVTSLEALSARTKISDIRDHGSERLGMVWAPDGKIIYGSRASGDAELWAMNSNGTEKRQLTSEQGPDLDPWVSPDGRTVVFTSGRNGELHVWRVNVDGSKPQQLTNGQRDYDPAISPDGKWIVYVSDFENNMNIWKRPLAGGDAIQLTHSHFAISPVASPDGKTIACYFTDSPTTWPKLSLLSLADGKLIKQFAINYADTTVVRWSPDGRAIAYIQTRGGVSNIYLQPVAGGPPKQLTGFDEDQIFRFDIARNGRLAFERGNTINEAVLIRSK